MRVICSRPAILTTFAPLILLPACHAGSIAFASLSGFIPANSVISTVVSPSIFESQTRPVGEIDYDLNAVSFAAK